MPEIKDVIKTRLGNRKLLSPEINRLIRDVSNIVGRESCLEPLLLKKALYSLGWDEHLLDYRTLELICVYIENERYAGACN